MDQTKLVRRIVIVGGSLLVLYFVDYLVGELFLPARAIVDAAAGYTIGILVHRYWSPKQQPQQNTYGSSDRGR